MPRLELNCDDLDYAAIQSAIALHQSMRIDGEHILPEHESDAGAATLAEICRHFVEWAHTP